MPDEDEQTSPADKTRSTPRGMPGSALLQFAGILSPEDAAIMRQAVDVDCEEIDWEDWDLDGDDWFGPSLVEPPETSERG